MKGHLLLVSSFQSLSPAIFTATVKLYPTNCFASRLCERQGITAAESRDFLAGSESEVVAITSARLKTLSCKVVHLQRYWRAQMYKPPSWLRLILVSFPQLQPWDYHSLPLLQIQCLSQTS